MRLRKDITNKRNILFFSFTIEVVISDFLNLKVDSTCTDNTFDLARDYTGRLMDQIFNCNEKQ